MKKIKILLCIIMLMCISVTGHIRAEVYDTITFFDSTSLPTYIVDKLPAATVRYNLQDSDNVYKLRLTVNNKNVNVIRLSVTSALTEKKYQFPIQSEGKQNLKIELLKNDESVYLNEYSIDYIKSAPSGGYGERGFNTHFTYNMYHDKDAELLKTVGAEIYRDSINWGSVESTKGVYTFTSNDNYLGRMLSSNVDMICVLNGENSLYKNSDGTTKITDESQINAFAEYALAVAKHYPKITRFEIYNEPGFEYTGEEYAKIAIATAKKLKEYNKNIELYAGSVVNENRATQTWDVFTDEFFDETLYPYVDAISYHYYAVGRYADHSGYINNQQAYLQKIAAQGGWKGLGLTETGWYVTNPADYATEYTQASELVKRAVMADDTGLAMLTFYDLKNDGTDSTEIEHNWGLYSHNFVMRDSYYTMKEYFKNVNKAQILGRVYIDGTIKAYAYAANDDYFIVAWAPNSGTPMITDASQVMSTSYDFGTDAEVKDMYGNSTGTGGVLNTYFEPKYVHNLSAGFILDAIAQYGTNEIIDTQAFVNAGYSQEIELLKNKFLNICTQKNIEAVEEYMNYCRDFGIEIINSYNNEELNITMKELSYILSQLEKAAERGGRLSVCMENVKAEVPNVLKIQYNQISDIIEFADLSGLTYLSEPYQKGEKLLKKIEKYNAGERTAPLQGEHFEIDSVGNIKITGGTSKDLVSISITKDEQVIYLDMLPVMEGVYETTTVLPGAGNYILTIDDDTKTVENIDYVGEYNSVEDKMTYFSVKIAESLYEWSKILMGGYFEDNKAYTFAEKNLDDIEIVTEDEKTYAKITDINKSGMTVAALCNGNQIVSITIFDNNVCMLDITGMDDYRIEIFRWDSINSMKPQDKAETLIKIRE